MDTLIPSSAQPTTLAWPVHRPGPRTTILVLTVYTVSDLCGSRSRFFFVLFILRSATIIERGVNGGVVGVPRPEGVATVGRIARTLFSRRDPWPVCVRTPLPPRRELRWSGVQRCSGIAARLQVVRGCCNASARWRIGRVREPPPPPRRSSLGQREEEEDGRQMENR